MADFNKVILVAKLGETPSLQQGVSGLFTVLRVANNRSRPDRETGEITRKALWHDVMVFGSFAETCVRNYRVGMEVMIEGELTYVEYPDMPYPKAQVVAKFVQLTGGKV